MFKLKIYMDNESIIKAKAERFDDFSPLFDQLKVKFGDKRGERRGK